MNALLFTLCLVVFVLLSRSSSAAAPPPVTLELPALTLGSVTYQHVHLVKLDAIRATLRHDGGMATILLATLPAGQQQALGYDPKSAALQQAKDRRTALRKAAAKDLRNSAITLSVTVLNITEDGLLADTDSGKTLFVKTPTEDSDYYTGRRYKFDLCLAGRFEYKTVLGSPQSVPAYRTLQAMLRQIGE